MNRPAGLTACILLACSATAAQAQTPTESTANQGSEPATQGAGTGGNAGVTPTEATTNTATGGSPRAGTTGMESTGGEGAPRTDGAVPAGPATMTGTRAPTSNARSDASSASRVPAATSAAVRARGRSTR